MMSETHRASGQSSFLSHCRNVARCHEGFASLMEDDNRYEIQFVAEFLTQRARLVEGILGGQEEDEARELAVAVAAGLFDRPSDSKEKVSNRASAMLMLLDKLAGMPAAETWALCEHLNSGSDAAEGRT